MIRLRFTFCGLTALLAAVSLASPAAALAPADRPVVVEYVAPPECASNEAFLMLLKTEIARSRNPDRPWRFAVHVLRQTGGYEGTLTTETGVRKVTAARCDDVTASLALIIAMSEPEELASPPSPPAA